MTSLNWKTINQLAIEGNLEPDFVIKKSDAEWAEQLTEEQYRITRLHGTERPFSSDVCEQVEEGTYYCVCCDTQLFNADKKFDSGTGWPSFTHPSKANVISYHTDLTLASPRVEVRCNTCEAHLGHVFPDGVGPSGLRYCINGVAMVKKEAPAETTAVFGGGCFWCTEAIFQQVKGVSAVESGYSGGDTENPVYRAVCSGETGHAEVVQVTYNPLVVSYEDLVRVHLGTHNPLTLNAQGADVGTQYRSVIFYNTDEERDIAERVIEELSLLIEKKLVTELSPLAQFYSAEENHQNYYERNTGKGYCQNVIDPKLAKFRKTFTHLLK